MNISFLNHCVFVKGSFPGKPDTESKLALEAHKLLFVFPFDIPLKQKKTKQKLFLRYSLRRMPQQIRDLLRLTVNIFENESANSA